jgi:protein phosphatase
MRKWNENMRARASRRPAFSCDAGWSLRRTIETMNNRNNRTIETIRTIKQTNIINFMKIILNQPYALNEIGGGSNNEDSVFPAKGKATENDRFFLVCDGIGGHQNGEIASRIVCESFEAFLRNVDAVDFNRTVFQQALDYAYEQLNREDSTKGERKMGTTLTFLYFHLKGVFMAHIGDSRIYHLRKQGDKTGILYKSRDHSYVNDLLRANIITAEEAETHSKKNVITRAMQPHQENTSRADIYETEDVQEGDYFFLCSDGVLEQVNDTILCEIVASQPDDKRKIDAIYDACYGHSKDNFSAYLVSVATVRFEPEQEKTESTQIQSDGEEVAVIPSTQVADSAPETPNQLHSPVKPETKQRRKNFGVVVWIIILLIVLAGGYYGFNYWKTSVMKGQPEIIDSPINEIDTRKLI